jgi:hypothetical protein
MKRIFILIFFFAFATQLVYGLEIDVKTVGVQSAKTEFEIIGSFPSIGALNLHPQEIRTIELTFNKGVDDTSYVITLVELPKASVAIPIEIEFSKDKKVLIVRPMEGLLKDDADYALIIHHIRSIDGVDLSRIGPYYVYETGYWWLPFSTGGRTVVPKTVVGGIEAGPKGGQMEVPIDANIEIFFTRQLNPSSVNRRNITMHKLVNDQPVGPPLPVGVMYQAVPSKIIIDPLDDLEYNTTYRIKLENLKDVLGNPVGD